MPHFARLRHLAEASNGKEQFYRVFTLLDPLASGADNKMAVVSLCRLPVAPMKSLATRLYPGNLRIHQA